MTEEERDNSLEDLFRKKLEENEMEPGSALAGHFMHRLERREFFRFNILRFNIYYLTFAIAALTVTGLILLNSPGNPDETAAAGISGQEAVAGIPGQEAAAGIPGQEAAAGIPRQEATSGIMRQEAAASVDDKSSGQEKMSLAGDTAETAAALTKAAAGPGKTAGTVDGSGKVTDRVKDREETITYDRQVAETVTVSTVSAASINATSGRTGTASVGSVAAAPAATALSFETSASSGCVPLHVSFACNAEENARVSWSFGDGGTSTLRNPDYIFDIPGSYRVTMTSTDGRGYTSVANAVVEVWDRPKAGFEVRKNEPFDEGDKVTFVNLSTGASDYLWDFGDDVFSTMPDPSHRYRQMGKYDVMLVAWSAEGCADSVMVSDLFTDSGMYIRFPNAFIPNSGGPTGGYYNLRTDEESSVFHPVAAGITDYNLKIYSKTGMMVFASDDTELGWDGYHRGELCAPGVYVWKVRGTYRDGRKFIMAGDVTLLKY